MSQSHFAALVTQDTSLPEGTPAAVNTKYSSKLKVRNILLTQHIQNKQRSGHLRGFLIFTFILYG